MREGGRRTRHKRVSGRARRAPGEKSEGQMVGKILGRGVRLLLLRLDMPRRRIVRGGLVGLGELDG